MSNAFNQLTVLHSIRDKAGNGMPDKIRNALREKSFFVSTCMREFAVFAGAHAAAAHRFDEIQRLSGSAAYAFLLQTVTGLNSSIPGETNIQGQVRKAWDSWRHITSPERLHALDPVMHRLFADAREIRRQFLQGIGGQSYGSLTRKLLNPGPDAHVLFVGAGDLARSITPYFAAFDTACWNRHATDAATVGTRTGFAPAESLNAACWATHVVLTTPADSHNDRQWRYLLDAVPTLEQVVHLGIRRAQRGYWENFSCLSDLDDVIELRQSQTSLRTLNVKRARRACDSRAISLAAAGLTSNCDRRVRAA